MSDDAPRLTPELVEELAARAQEDGLLGLKAVSLDHPGFEAAADALDRQVSAGKHGEMEFMARTAAVRRDPSRMLPGARSILVAMVPYRGRADPIARYAQGPDYHGVLHRRLEGLARALEQRLPSVETIACVDTKPILERAAAALAGLGFLGKHGCLIAPGLGSYVLLGSLLTTAEWTGALEPRQEGVLWDACGSCRLCLDACPTDAFEGPGELDPTRCISYLTIEHRGPIAEELADRMGERVVGCDVCQEVCPYNAGRRRNDRVVPHAWLDAEPSATATSRRGDLVHLAGLRSGRYRAFVRGTAMNRIPRRSLRRNALLAIGNGSGPLSDEEREVVDRGSSDDDPQVSAAARRALARRGDG